MKEILRLLHSKEWVGISDYVEIAKGKYELAMDYQDTKKKIKRAWQSKRL